MIDLKLLSKQVDELLDSETDESLNAWLSEYNSKNMIATRFGAGRVESLQEQKMTVPSSQLCFPAKFNVCKKDDHAGVTNYAMAA